MLDSGETAIGRRLAESLECRRTVLLGGDLLLLLVAAGRSWTWTLLLLLLLLERVLTIVVVLELRVEKLWIRLPVRLTTLLSLLDSP